MAVVEGSGPRCTASLEWKPVLLPKAKPQPAWSPRPRNAELNNLFPSSDNGLPLNAVRRMLYLPPSPNAAIRTGRVREALRFPQYRSLILCQGSVLSEAWNKPVLTLIKLKCRIIHFQYPADACLDEYKKKGAIIP